MKEKMIFMMVVIAILVVFANQIFSAEDDGFYAYYTKVEHNETDLERKHTGKYADVVVHFADDSRVVFSRHTSYLPFYENGKDKFYFDEIVKRTGDGTGMRPDKINRYSYARIIEADDTKTVIHWRYMADFSNVEWDGVVDEYFTITPEKNVKRTIREGTKKIDDWNNPHNRTIQQLKLNENGIKQISLTRAVVKETKEEPIEGSPVIEKTVSTPAVHFKFNEAMGENTIESISGSQCQIGGPKSLWKKGVSGTALQFDGYYSNVTLPSEKMPDLKDGLTSEAWVALGAYPFGWAPIIGQYEWQQDGFYLGVSETGNVGFFARIGDKWQTARTKERLELFRWYHVAGLYDKTKGQLMVFIDGRQQAVEEVEGKELSASGKDLIVGLNNRKMPAIEGRIRRGKWPSLYGIDGLIDEVKIYPKVLNADKISTAYENVNPSDTLHEKPDMDARHFPANPKGQKAERFGAEYTRLPYYETWDNLWRVSEHPDVIVSFDELPVKFAFWRGTSSGIGLVTENGKWGGEQSSENYRQTEEPGEAEGCCEHMSDKQCRHAHVRIIENTEARAVVHYRYGLVDSRYYFVTAPGEAHDDWVSSPWGDWADEYWTIYPDGVGVRHLARGKIWGDSWVETMFYSEPGTWPEDNVELKAYTIVNDEGDVQVCSWADGDPKLEFDEPVITMINTKSDYRPFNVYTTDSSVEVFGGTGRGISHFHFWNHWPCAQITSDGRGARANDRAAHSSLVWGNPSKDYLIYGLTNKKPETLLPLSKSWNHPPELTEARGSRSHGYKQEQRAYILTAESDEMSFILNAGKDSPLVNPCFVIKNWNSDSLAEIKINGSTAPARQGVVRDTDGRRMLIVWLEAQQEEKVKFKISKTN